MSELDRFAEHVRITCQKILAASHAGDRVQVANLVATLGELASDIIEKGGMGRDASDPGRYDLTTLPFPDASEESE